MSFLTVSADHIPFQWTSVIDKLVFAILFSWQIMLGSFSALCNFTVDLGHNFLFIVIIHLSCILPGV